MVVLGISTKNGSASLKMEEIVEPGERLANFFKNGTCLLERERDAFEGRLTKFVTNLRFRLGLFRKTKKEFDLYLASDFNVIEYIAPAKDETPLSAIIADLLRPDGKHGQGNVFLNSFFAVFLKSEKLRIFSNDDNIEWKIDTESPTNKNPEYPNRRIDITIDGGDFGIGIENKPTAGDQGTQLHDYSKHLDVKYRGEYVLIYLAEKGRVPNEKSISKTEREGLTKAGKFLIASYQDELKEWLGVCYRESKADKVRWFLADFIEYIDRHFQNNTFNSREGENSNENGK